MSDNSEYAAPVPRAVREQAERAEQLARELGSANVADAPDEGREQGGDGTPSSPPEHQEPDDQRAPVREPEDESWRQRFNTLQGKYDNEVPQLYGQIRNLTNLITSMQNAAPPPQPPPPPPVAPQITDEDREMWGDDLPNAVSRWVGNPQDDRIRSLEAQVQYLAGGQQRVDTSLTQQSVMSQLDMDPDLTGRWRQLNDAPAFLSWLSELDQFSARPRIELLREAYAQGDANRTGRFFKSYLAEHTAPPGSRAPAHTQLNGSAGRMRLEELAAPGRAAASGTNGGASPERRMWTNREIGAFYRDVQRGVYRTRQADKDRIEADILAAASEGRVTQ
jgi:hypothetical protein